MKNVFFIVLFASAALLTGCKKEVFKAPEINTPANLSVVVGAATEVSFTYTAEAGFKSANVVSTNGTSVIKTNGTAGSTTGTIVITYTAGSATGAGSVELTVTDNEDQTGKSTAVISLLEQELVIMVTGNITQNTTWETGKEYILTTRVSVVSGTTLTIQPGVVVKGQAGTGANATALIIARGGKIMAEGTASSPIIFTSVADEIKPGQVASPNLEVDLNGLWGGLIVLGNAPISADAASVQIEGIPPSDQNGLYGGTNPTDNSGVIKFVSIRHGGANIGEGNEINGLTLGGVGSGTIIENVEIIANQDDGIEFFGGTVNVKNAIVWNAGDDAIDTDQSWAGTLDNFIVMTPGDECFELDGPEGAMLAGHILKNGSVKAGTAQGLVDTDDNSIFEMANVYFFGIVAGQDFDDNPTGGGMTLSNLQATIPDGTSLSAFFKEGVDAFVTAVPVGGRTVGADVSKFQTWSWAAVSGMLAGF
jgi:hypothetical protein